MVGYWIAGTRYYERCRDCPKFLLGQRQTNSNGEEFIVCALACIGLAFSLSCARDAYSNLCPGFNDLPTMEVDAMGDGIVCLRTGCTRNVKGRCAGLVTNVVRDAGACYRKHKKEAKADGSPSD